MVNNKKDNPIISPQNILIDITIADKIMLQTNRYINIKPNKSLNKTNIYNQLYFEYTINNIIIRLIPK